MNSQPESPVTSLNLTVATTSRAPMSEMQSIYELVQGSETIDKQACVDILLVVSRLGARSASRGTHPRPRDIPHALGIGQARALTTFNALRVNALSCHNVYLRGRSGYKAVRDSHIETGFAATSRTRSSHASNASV